MPKLWEANPGWLVMPKLPNAEGCRVERTQTGADQMQLAAITSMVLYRGGATWIKPTEAAQLLLRSGDVYQFGVASGSTLTKVLSKSFEPVKPKLWGFDSFEGMPAEADNVTTAWKVGEFKQADPEKLMERLSAQIARMGLQVGFERGFYSQSLTANLACRRSMRAAAYLDIDCDIYTGATQALEWAFTSQVVQVGTVIGYDDWWVMPCSGSDPDVWKFGEAKAHLQIANQFGVRFECLAGPCTTRAGAFCAGIPPGNCWRPYFIVREIGSAQPAHGFTLATAEAERFMREQMGNPKSLCANARNKNPLWSRVGDQVAGTHVATASARPLATKAGAGAAAPPPTLPSSQRSKLAKQAKRQQSSTA